MSILHQGKGAFAKRTHTPIVCELRQFFARKQRRILEPDEISYWI
jgi:hypothetical protein